MARMNRAMTIGELRLHPRPLAQARGVRRSNRSSHYAAASDGPICPAKAGRASPIFIDLFLMQSNLRFDCHFYRASRPSVDELVHIFIAAPVNLPGRAVPDDLAAIEHGDAIRYLARTHHVMSDG